MNQTEQMLTKEIAALHEYLDEIIKYANNLQLEISGPLGKAKIVHGNIPRVNGHISRIKNMQRLLWKTKRQKY